MLSGAGSPSGRITRAGAGMGAFFYPSAGIGNPTGKNSIWRMRVWVPTTHRVCTRCHLEARGAVRGAAAGSARSRRGGR